MLHGFPNTWYGWRKQISAVPSCGFHAIAPDHRGHADTSAPPRRRRWCKIAQGSRLAATRRTRSLRRGSVHSRATHLAGAAPKL
eukprot:NODE_25976_length_569_cov_1.642534.p4 GENE.NODE_25976_length_569_cov_1.642534~~NODE_25976_length_569_cov_1.642534.p4  ORF type:complete len:84 (-),score=5.84 NODE_25976_length_569_cov_1.642534:135-386(-)